LPFFASLGICLFVPHLRRLEKWPLIITLTIGHCPEEQRQELPGCCRPLVERPPAEDGATAIPERRPHRPRPGGFFSGDHHDTRFLKRFFTFAMFLI
jgi:hypothetical protein